MSLTLTRGYVFQTPVILSHPNLMSTVTAWPSTLCARFPAINKLSLCFRGALKGCGPVLYFISGYKNRWLLNPFRECVVQSGLHDSLGAREA